ncbi:MAG: hypothetical protein J2O48_04245 [Solirubrobacterales bacterium]|nr:hypothetical protein [Solirubrobacterales bacterium]
MGLGVLGFSTLLIHLKSLWKGIPAHPLLIHVPVILVPVSVLGALAVAAWPALQNRYGTLLSIVAIIAMSSIFLAMGAGDQLAHATHDHDALLKAHAHAATTLEIVFIITTAVLILNFAAFRISNSHGPTGLKPLDLALGNPVSGYVLRGALVVLALISAYAVYHVGDLGAQHVWAGTLKS